MRQGDSPSPELLDGPSGLNIHPKAFVPPNEEETPETLFPPTTIPHASVTHKVNRLINRDDDKCMLIYTDGVYLDIEDEGPLFGCSIVYKGDARSARALGETNFIDNDYRNYSCFALEMRGPSGEDHTPTTQRAKLRAVIAALQFRNWDSDGFNKLVIATDSEYIVEGITTRVHAWAHQNWVTRDGFLVCHYDLWKCLVEELENARNRPNGGLNVEFWHISPSWNTEANGHADFAARFDEVPSIFAPIIGARV
ncbi:ribonuclease H-like domain-containing protein [Penicillium malachiteum]|uniref:ribonuclease H-like domain-containing protein n=1 Tax=Penicillium malachiteum TaxID=1324776 RepID=UPI002547EE4C|nr:ribonuclease H-like domain-containing protein [Penicillium malachiteum]KAJ5725475.1 ribonuclease H-like domain-containing protein [Penicillium malachiteum]